MAIELEICTRCSCAVQEVNIIRLLSLSSYCAVSVFCSAGPESSHSATPLRKTSKKTLSELHKELLKKAEGLNLTTPAEQPANCEGGINSLCAVADAENSNEFCAGTSESVEGSCVEIDVNGGGDLKSLADASNIPVDHGSSRSKSRKAAKPVKRGHEPAVEFVEIQPAHLLPFQCVKCSYTCVCKTHLDIHVAEVHRSTQDVDRSTQPYACQLCPWFGSSKEVFERHTAHHPGQHVVRYHSCPYCLFCTTDMPTIEAHLPATHPSDTFRFEVVQQCISYKQKLMECPVCQGLYQWQQDLKSHFRNSHSLESLASYVESTYTEQSELTTVNVPKELFNDVLDRYAAGALADDTDAGFLAEDTDAELVSPEKVEEDASSCTPKTAPSILPRAPDVGTVIRFHCSSCDFNCEDFELFRKHCASHSGSAARSNGDYSIPSKSGPNTYRCHLCPFLCNKMVHYRRHLEIHERNQSLAEGFRCGYCHFAHYRQNCVKFHLGKYHGDRPVKMSRIVDGVEVELSETDLYAMRSRKGGSSSSVLGRQSGSSASLIGHSSDREKRPTNRYTSEGNVPLLAIERTSSVRNSQLSPAEKSSAPSGVSEQAHGSTAELEEAIRALDLFEQELPAQMIYPDPVNCPRCDFSNRVRVNMIRHLKLHRDEDNAMFGMSNPQPGTAAGHFDMQKNGSLESTADSEKPLLRQILSEKPVVCIHLMPLEV